MSPDITPLPWSELYRRLAELAEVYLEPPYDHLVYVVRGGMTPAHRLAHVLGMQGEADSMAPLVIKRHAEDGIQAVAHKPRLEGALPPLRPGSRVLLVDDTIGAGETLAVAYDAVMAAQPARVDIVSVGFDHGDWTAKGVEAARAIAPAVIVGFDYWGWMVFPWENQAGEHSEPQPLRSGAPYAAPSWTAEALARLAEKDRPERKWLIVTAEPDGKRAFGVPELAKFDILREDKMLELASLPVVGVDVVVMEDRLVSRVPLRWFQEWAESVAAGLAPGGWLVFDFLDRTLVKRPEDLATGEYFTPELLTRLLRRAGFAEVEILGHAGVSSLAVARRP
jgi:hypoxanthine phosphoribosyltransferase